MNNNPHKQTRFARVLITIVKPFVKVFCRVKVKGLENLPAEGGYVLCSNHISYMDPVFWLVFTKKRIQYMAKAELFKNKLVTWFFNKVGVFPVTRDGGNSGAVNHAIKLVSDGGILGIFPEGTRSKDNKPAKAKAGTAYIANATSADIVPAAVCVKSKVRPFRKTLLIIGKPISHEEIHFEGTDRKGLRNASVRIMDEITKLWEQGQNEL